MNVWHCYITIVALWSLSNRMSYYFFYQSKPLPWFVFYLLKSCYIYYLLSQCTVQSTNTFLVWIDIEYTDLKRKGGFLTEIPQQKILTGKEFLNLRSSNPDLLRFAATHSLKDLPTLMAPQGSLSPSFVAWPVFLNLATLLPLSDIQLGHFFFMFPLLLLRSSSFLSRKRWQLGHDRAWV